MLDVEATVVGGAFQSHSGSPLSVLCPDWSSPIGKPARYLRWPTGTFGCTDYELDCRDKFGWFTRQDFRLKNSGLPQNSFAGITRSPYEGLW